MNKSGKKGPLLLVGAVVLVAAVIVVSVFVVRGIEQGAAPETSASPPMAESRAPSTPIDWNGGPGGEVPPFEVAPSMVANSVLPRALDGPDTENFLAHHSQVGLYIPAPYSGQADLTNADNAWSFVVFILTTAYDYECRSGTELPVRGDGVVVMPIELAEDYSRMLFGYKYPFGEGTPFTDTASGVVLVPDGYDLLGHPYAETDTSTLLISNTNLITVEADIYQGGPGETPAHLGRYVYTYEYLPHNTVPYQLVSIARK